MGLNTESLYDWEHSKWTVPVNVFAQQLLKVGELPIALQLGGRYYADGPRGAPDWAPAISGDPALCEMSSIKDARPGAFRLVGHVKKRLVLAPVSRGILGSYSSRPSVSIKVPCQGSRREGPVGFAGFFHTTEVTTAPFFEGGLPDAQEV